MQTIRKAIFPVAGMGTRFLPATKATPKEMLPIVDKPLIQYAIENAVTAGITEFIFVTNHGKRAIEDHFDTNFELETRLLNAGKMELLESVRKIVPNGIRCAYIRQSSPLGLGHAVLCAQSVIGNEPFAVILADDLIDAPTENCMQQMVKLYEQLKANIIAVEGIIPEQSSQYGIVNPIEGEGSYRLLQGIVEKPLSKDAPSNFGVVGRYILTPVIFDYLKQTPKGTSNEIQLTDAIAALIKNQHAVYAYEFTGTRYDCGNKLGYLQATVAFGLKHPDISHEFAKYLKSLN
jgi:UTP--glucose-1-phosphate uridylyltransferase